MDSTSNYSRYLQTVRMRRYRDWMRRSWENDVAYVEAQAMSALIWASLPDIYSECETCSGTGYSPEAWDVKLKGLTLPEVNNLTITQVYELFKDYPRNQDTARTSNRRRTRIPRTTPTGIQSIRGRSSTPQNSHGANQEEKTGYALTYLMSPRLGKHMEDLSRLIGRASTTGG